MDSTLVHSLRHLDGGAVWVLEELVQVKHYPDEDFLHEALIEEINECYDRHDLRRCVVLWKCYDVMFIPPLDEWDLKCRQALGYPR